MSTDETTNNPEPTEEQIEEMIRRRELESQSTAHFYVELTPEA